MCRQIHERRQARQAAGFLRRYGRLSNHWITLHETGNVSGFNPVMDVWEHAFLLDYKRAERPKHIEAFFSNIDWDACDERLRKGTAARSSAASIL